jgi:hypothetical protein
VEKALSIVTTRAAAKKAEATPTKGGDKKRRVQEVIDLEDEDDNQAKKTKGSKQAKTGTADDASGFVQGLTEDLEDDDSLQFTGTQLRFLMGLNKGASIFGPK